VRLCLGPPAVGFAWLSCVWPASGSPPPLVTQKKRPNMWHMAPVQVGLLIQKPKLGTLAVDGWFGLNSPSCRPREAK
jgi:hypothetical protein